MVTCIKVKYVITVPIPWVCGVPELIFIIKLTYFTRIYIICIYIYFYLLLYIYTCHLYLSVPENRAERASSFPRPFVHPAVTYPVLVHGHR